MLFVYPFYLSNQSLFVLLYFLSNLHKKLYKLIGKKVCWTWFLFELFDLHYIYCFFIAMASVSNDKQCVFLKLAFHVSCKTSFLNNVMNSLLDPFAWSINKFLPRFDFTVLFFITNFETFFCGFFLDKMEKTSFFQCILCGYSQSHSLNYEWILSSLAPNLFLPINLHWILWLQVQQTSPLENIDIYLTHIKCYLAVLYFPCITSFFFITICHYICRTTSHVVFKLESKFVMGSII